MLKVVWLAQYNVFNLLPDIKLNRKVILHNSSWIHALSEELANEKDIELHVITHSQLVDYSQTIVKNKIYFHVIKYCFPFTKRGFPWYLPLDKLTRYHTFSNQAKKVIDRIKPNVLHVHGTEGGYFIPAFKTKIPCLISMQGIISEIIKIEPSVTGYLQLFYERYAIKKGKHFGCRTNFDFDYINQKNSTAVIHDLPEAINKVFFENYWTPTNALTIIFVGSILKRKGIEDLIQAVFILKKDYPEIILKIIGTGEREYVLSQKTIAKKLHLTSNIHWLGNKTPNEIAVELSKCSLFVLPTLVDNSPNSLVEAMAVGVPSIAASVGGIPSMIDDNIDGMLVAKKDINELVKRIKQLADDKDLQHRMSTNARTKVFKRNFPENVVTKYITVYKSLVNEST